VFVVNLITGIIVFVSTLCCIIPVFFVAPRIIFAPVYQVEHPEAGIFESISASWNMSSDNTFSLLGLGFIIVGIAIVGFCCCCIGIFFAEAIELFALTAAYYQLKGNLQ
jgi:membrane-anchored glycerophosphoryl diester phosphodiesterase (GDPDase)